MKTFTPHGLRHAHSTIMLSKGIPLQTIANRLRNAAMMILSVSSPSFLNFQIKLAKAYSVAVTIFKLVEYLEDTFN